MSEKLINQIVIFFITLSTFLLGVSGYLIGEHRSINLITDFYMLNDLFSASTFNMFSVVGYLVAGILALVSLKRPTLEKALGLWLMMLSIIPLLSLFGASMWIDKLGGFPAIGSGQGVIKYFALFSLGFYFYSNKTLTKAATWVQLIPVLIVLMWIGGMKFTLLEAKGIEALVTSSPLMSWMYQVWDLQTTSNLIGVYDLLAIALLIGAMFYRQLIWPALLMAGAVFVVTQTFLFTWDAALSADTLLTTGGHFLIKDVWFIANLALVYKALNKKHS